MNRLIYAPDWVTLIAEFTDEEETLLRDWGCNYLQNDWGDNSALTKLAKLFSFKFDDDGGDNKRGKRGSKKGSSKNE